MQKVKYKKGDIIKVFNKAYKVTNVRRNGFTGVEYDIEAFKPDINGYFDTMTKIPQGFIARKL